MTTATQTHTFDAATMAELSKCATAAMRDIWGMNGHSDAEIAVLEAQVATEPCERCAGSGRYVTAIVNGKPTGPGGMCYRCRGKGTQTASDVKRNDYYDAHRPVGGGY